ncbi:MAG: hypothetical protein QOD86_1671 [Miltoncostaeaceae bacterium]|jgi:hypothetical protein|nr:hypothetical protein [Miltoncostaeaceae bacterium]
MLRRAGLVALAVMALVIAATALASATGRESDDRGVQVVKLDFTTVKAVDADLGDPGFGPGDRHTFLDELYKDGEKVGELGGDCVVVDLDGRTGFTTQCQATASLPDGQIATQGLLGITNGDVQRFSLAVVGGTGDYRTVGGEVRVEEHSEEGHGTIAVTLLR